MNDMRKLMEAAEKLYEDECIDLGEVDDAAEHFGYDLEDDEDFETFFNFIHDEWHEVEADEPAEVIDALKGAIPSKILKKFARDANEYYIADELLDHIAEDITSLGLRIQCFVNGSALIFRVVKG